MAEVFGECFQRNVCGHVLETGFSDAVSSNEGDAEGENREDGDVEEDGIAGEEGGKHRLILA